MAETIFRFEDIEGALNAGKLLRNWAKGSIQSASYDLRVGTIFKDAKIVNGEHEERERSFLIQPGEIISIFTLEELSLPPNIVGVAFAINKWSSEGLLVLNPGHVDPGYCGPLTVRAINLRKTPISISREQPIFTIVFHDIGSSTGHPYQNASLSRVEKEKSFHAREQEIAPASLGNLLGVMSDLPFATKEQVDRAIRDHWMARWTLGLLIVASIASVLAVVIALINS